MFERFTADGRIAVVQAQTQARRWGHGHVGCEHLLYAVAGSDAPAGQVLRDLGVTPESVASAISSLLGTGLDRDALAHIGIDLDVVRERVEAAFGPGALTRRPEPPPRRRRWRRWRSRGGRRDRPPSGHIPFTPRAKRCLERSLREAVNRRDHHVGVEHLALALASMHDGLAPRVLGRLGVAPAQVRAEIQYRYRDAG